MRNARSVTVGSHLASLAALAALLTLAALPGVARAQASRCVPGTQIECSCMGGRKSVQVCAPDGASFQPCQCQGYAAPPANAGASGPPWPPPPPAGAPPPGPGWGAPPSAFASSGATGLTITTPGPASVELDGADVGRAPLELLSLQPGVHLVRVTFDGGGEVARKALVRPGEVTRLVIEQPPSSRAAEARKGLKQAVEVGGEVDGLENHFGPALSGAYLLNLGLTKNIDLRVGGRLTLFASIDRGFVVVAGAPVSARFNFGSKYAIGVGGFLGLRYAPAHHWSAQDVPPYDSSRPHEIGLLGGPELSPLVLRLGARRQFEIALTGALLFPISSSEEDGYLVNRIAATVTMLLL
jgi:hypothetical protein